MSGKKDLEDKGITAPIMEEYLWKIWKIICIFVKFKIYGNEYFILFIIGIWGYSNLPDNDCITYLIN